MKNALIPALLPFCMLVYIQTKTLYNYYYQEVRLQMIPQTMGKPEIKSILSKWPVTIVITIYEELIIYNQIYDSVYDLVEFV